MVSINFIPEPCLSREVGDRHIAYAKASGLPYVKEAPRPALIVLGGGHSITPLVDELRAWTGDIWACGSVFQWCRKNGIEATFFAVDPLPEVAAMAEGAKKAVIAECVDPLVIEALRGAHTELFELIERADRLNHGTTAATCTPQLSIEAGYRDITYIGCDSSFSECFVKLDDPAASIYITGGSHAYKNDRDKDGGYISVRVKCGEQAFITCAELLVQAEYLSEMLRVSPLFKERSGGLLRAMVKNRKFDITHGSQYLHDKIAHNRAALVAAHIYS